MNAHRLLTLAAFLDHVDANRFYMGFWASHADLNVCGSRGCAIGLATTIPEFSAAGLCLAQSDLGTNHPMFQKRTGFDAVMQFFDIDGYAAVRLFSPLGYGNQPRTQSAGDVASNIRRFVASDPGAAAFIAEVEQQAKVNERAAIQAEANT